MSGTYFRSVVVKYWNVIPDHAEVESWRHDFSVSCMVHLWYTSQLGHAIFKNGL